MIEYDSILTWVLSVFRLHMLCELEHSIKPLFHQSPGDSSQEDSLNWVARLEMTQNSYRAKEPILALRRALLSLNKRFFTLFFFISVVMNLVLYLHIIWEYLFFLIFSLNLYQRFFSCQLSRRHILYS